MSILGNANSRYTNWKANIMIDSIIIGIYLVGVLIVGLISGRNIKDVHEYSVAKNTFSTFVLMAAIFATLVGGGSTMGVSEKVFSTGIVFLLLCLCFIIRDIITAFFIVPRFDQFGDCLTVGDIMAKYYGRTGKILVGVAGTLQGSVFLGMQVAASGHLFNYFLDLPYAWGVVIGMGVVIVYSAFGGIRAVTITDVVQFSVLIVAIPMTFTIGVDMVGGFPGLINSVPPEKLSLLPKSNDEIRFYSLMLVFALPYMDPALVQRLLMGRDIRQVKKALLISSLGRLPYLFMVGVLGLVAFIIKPDLQPDLAFPYLVNHILPVGIKGLVISGLLAVLMSTADSYLHVTGLLFTHDVIKPLRKTPWADRDELRMARWITAFIGILSILGAILYDNLIELNILAYVFWMPAICVPLISGVMGKVGSMRAFLCSGSLGIMTFLSWKFFFYERTAIDSLLPALTMSGLSFFSIYWIEKCSKVDWPKLKNFSIEALFPSFVRPTRQAIDHYRDNIFRNIIRFFKFIINVSAERVDVFGAPYGLFVLFAIAHLCFMPFIFTSTSGLTTPNYVIYLRVTATITSFFLVMKDFWPRKMSSFLPLYWHITLFICLPYFAFCMCFFSSCAIEWVIDLVLIIFILGVLVDWKTYISMILAGLFLGALTFYGVGDVGQFNFNLGNLPIMAYSIAVSLGVGVLFSRNKERVLMEKMGAFKALGGTIAHEMRTPLSSIHVSASGLKDCLPALVDGYHQARAAGLRVPKISQLALESVANVPERMRYICASTLNIIDMLLLQLKDDDWSAHFNNCSIKDCVDTALNEYCFRENERELVDCQRVEDFPFYGNRYLVVHILFNLMRNAFIFIQSEKRGTITLWTSESPGEYHLHFCDTAKGISKQDLPYIFDHGFSKRSGGSGVGLHYCRKMMTTMAGGIAVKAVEGTYCEFILSFVKTKEKTFKVQ